jgi:hypothetical protein
MTAFRLHIASNVQVADNFKELFITLSQQAATLLEGGLATDATMWEVAQYVDLADAGYGSKRTVLYRRAINALGAYVRAHMDRPTTRGMFGRSAALSRLMERVLDERVADLDASTLPSAQVITLAA